MDAGADAGRRKRQLAGIGLGVIDQLLRGLERRVRMHRQHELRAREQRHRDEVLAGVVGQLVLQQPRIGDEGRCRPCRWCSRRRARRRPRGCRSRSRRRRGCRSRASGRTRARSAGPAAARTRRCRRPAHRARSASPDAAGRLLRARGRAAGAATARLRRRTAACSSRSCASPDYRSSDLRETGIRAIGPPDRRRGPAGPAHRRRRSGPAPTSHR